MGSSICGDNYHKQLPLIEFIIMNGRGKRDLELIVLVSLVDSSLGVFNDRTTTHMVRSYELRGRLRPLSVEEDWLKVEFE